MKSAATVGSWNALSRRRQRERIADDAEVAEVFLGKERAHMANHDVRQLVQDWNRLDAAGIPLEPLENRVGIDMRTSGTGLTVRAGRDRRRSEIRELKNGHFAFILPVFIRRDRPGKTIICDAWIGTSWPDTSIEWLDDPEQEEKHPGYFNLPGDTERFLREQVLNYRFINRTLSRGDIRSGLLLAVGSRPPDIYKDNDLVSITLTVVDQWDSEQKVALQMKMNRRPARAEAIHTSARSPLLSRQDVIVPTRPYVAPRQPTAESREKEAADCRWLQEDIARFQAEHEKARTPIATKPRER